MRRVVLLATALALAGVLLVPSGAVPLLDQPTDQISEDVELYPSDSPDGRFAYLDENDELVVDISAANPKVNGTVGVNPEGVTTFENVFRIHYNGSQFANVWLTHDADVLTFTARGHPIGSRANNVTLGPNESVGVGIRVDTTGQTVDAVADEFTIHATVGTPATPGGDGSTDADATQLDVSRLEVTVLTPADGRRVVRIANLAVGDRLDVDLERMHIVREDVTLDAVNFTSQTAGDATLTFQRRDAPPSGVVPPNATMAIEPRGYFTLGHTIDGSEVADTSFEFSARTAYLNRTGVDPTAVTLLRYDGDGWQRLETRVTGRHDGRVHFNAPSPGLSTFAVGTDTEQMAPTPTGTAAAPPATPAPTATRTAVTATTTTPTDEAAPVTAPSRNRRGRTSEAGGFGALSVLALLVSLGATLAATVAFRRYRSG
jgi:hypothetical protein